MFLTANELLEVCAQQNKAIWQITLAGEAKSGDITEQEVLERLGKAWEIMVESSEPPLHDSTIKGRIIGGEAQKVWQHYQEGKSICGKTMSKIMAYALSVSITNASMGRIVAAPTAGSAGVMPAVFRGLQEDLEISQETILQGLLTAGAIGEIIAHSASISGAAGGCQAEVGTAAAMTAGGVVAMLGGNPEQVFDAAAIALKNLLGLVCDPVAGLVECPCSKRNVIGAANGMLAAEMVLAGVTSFIPFDEVVTAMEQVGSLMPAILKETASGGLATTATGREFANKLEAAREKLTDH